MKRYFLIIFLLTFFGGHAQKYEGGGLGYFSPGVNFGSFGSISSTLNQEGILADGESLSGTGLTLGGGGFGLFASKIILGGRGFGVRHASETFASTDATIRKSSGGGFFQIGYTIVKKDRILLFPTLGIGGIGHVVNIQNNNTITPLAVGEEIILADDSEDFELGSAMLELAVNWHNLLSGSGGGFTLGLSAGYYMSLGAAEWTADQEILDTVEPAPLRGFFITLNLGGGGFE